MPDKELRIRVDTPGATYSSSARNVLNDELHSVLEEYPCSEIKYLENIRNENK